MTQQRPSTYLRTISFTTGACWCAGSPSFSCNACVPVSEWLGNPSICAGDDEHRMSARGRACHMRYLLVRCCRLKLHIHITVMAGRMRRVWSYQSRHQVNI